MPAPDHFTPMPLEEVESALESFGLGSYAGRSEVSQRSSGKVELKLADGKKQSSSGGRSRRRTGGSTSSCTSCTASPTPKSGLSKPPPPRHRHRPGRINDLRLGMYLPGGFQPPFSSLAVLESPASLGPDTTPGGRLVLESCLEVES